MEVHLTADQQEMISRLAADKGCDANIIAQEAINYYLEEQARFVADVKLGEEELERGEYLTHEEVGARIERMLRS